MLRAKRTIVDQAGAFMPSDESILVVDSASLRVIDGNTVRIRRASMAQD
jgi:hypothetical protein